MNHTVTANETQFFNKINSYLYKDDRICIRKAYEFARREHGDQRRKSGELFFTHPLTVAYYLAEYHLDAPAVAAALLHDVAEDTRISIMDIESRFGPEVARLVDGVTKLKNVTAGVTKGKQLTQKEIEDATLHKLLAVMTMDVRTVIIKLFDRLHNMRTIKAMPRHKQVQKAKETLSVYAPLSNRLGIWKLKNELESLSLEIIQQRAYILIQNQLNYIHAEQRKMFDQIRQEIFDCLLQANLDIRKISLEPQNVYTVYQDLAAKGSDFHHIDKVLRLEILVGDWMSCYLALGYIHQLWKPLPGNFDDYVAVPRDNLYRSLHTTVVHHNGQHIKLRFRTVTMSKVSEIGILARWLYAETPLWSKGIADRVETFFDNINENINVEPQNPSAGVKGVVEDVFRKQIQVYTPRGQMVDLAQGATAIDFAYAIHTGLGDQCHAAYVNEVLYPLHKPLKDGDQVRIVKRLRAQPRRAWLDEDLGYVATNYARSHIRRWFRRLPDETAIAHGKKLLKDELAMLNLSEYPHQKIAAAFDFENTLHLYYNLGRAELLPTVVATRVVEDNWSQEEVHRLDNVVYAPTGEQFVITNADGRELQLCGTCNPRPGEQIFGFLRANNGVTVHKESCHTLRPERLSGRLLKLGWGAATTREAHLITIQADVYDRSGLLFEITQLVHHEHINISYIHTPPRTRKGETQIILTLEIVRPRQLVRILHQIQALANIYAVQVLPSGPPIVKDYLPASLYRPE